MGKCSAKEDNGTHKHANTCIRHMDRFSQSFDPASAGISFKDLSVELKGFCSVLSAEARSRKSTALMYSVRACAGNEWSTQTQYMHNSTDRIARPRQADGQTSLMCCCWNSMLPAILTL